MKKSIIFLAFILIFNLGYSQDDVDRTSFKGEVLAALKVVSNEQAQLDGLVEEGTLKVIHEKPINRFQNELIVETDNLTALNLEARQGTGLHIERMPE